MLPSEQIEFLENLIADNGKVLIDHDGHNFTIWNMDSSDHSRVNECLGIGADLQDAIITAAEE